MMNRRFLSSIALLFLAWPGSAQDAERAFADFNSQFLDSEKQIYMVYPQSNQVAAIWTQAIYWDMAMMAYGKTKSPQYAKLIKQIYEGNYKHYDGYNWNNSTVWFIYDDLMWWIISFARAYELTQDPTYLAHAVLGFERVWSGTPKVADKGSYDPERGGMFWGWKSDQRGKTACINYPSVVAAVHLYRATKDKSYLEKAKSVYAWSREALFDKQQGKVGDHQVPGHKTNWTVNLYNQATCIGAGVLLYEETKNKDYLEDAKLAANYVKDSMSDPEGILPFKNGIEQGIYTAIFAQYIQQLFPYDKKDVYKKWLAKNVEVAWKNRDDRGLMDKNFHRKAHEKTEVYDASAAVALMQILR